MKNLNIKNLIAILILVTPSAFTMAGGMDGGGGFTLACPKPNMPKYGEVASYVRNVRKATYEETIQDWKSVIDFKLYDYYTAKEKEISSPSMGAPDLSVEAKIDIALNRLKRLDPLRAKMYKMLTTEFLTNKYKEVKRERGKKATPYIVDMGPGNIPNECELYLAISQINPDPKMKEVRYTVTEEFWDVLDNDSKAGLVLHEVIYREAGLAAGAGSSKYVQKLVALITSKDFEKQTRYDYVELIKRLDFLFTTSHDGIMVWLPSLPMKYIRAETGKAEDWPNKNQFGFAQAVDFNLIPQFPRFGDRGQILLRSMGFRFKPYYEGDNDDYNWNISRNFNQRYNKNLDSVIEKELGLKSVPQNADQFDTEAYKLISYPFGTSTVEVEESGLSSEYNLKWKNGKLIVPSLHLFYPGSILGFTVSPGITSVIINSTETPGKYSLTNPVPLYASAPKVARVEVNNGTSSLTCEVVDSISNGKVYFQRDLETGKTVFYCNGSALESQFP